MLVGRVEEGIAQGLNLRIWRLQFPADSENGRLGTNVHGHLI